MRTKLARLWALAQVIIATALWGFGFIAVVWALQSFDAFFINTFRLLVAAALAWIGILSLKRIRHELSWRTFIVGFWPGIFLGACLLFQTSGQRYTTATNSGFITVLYVVFVPIVDWAFFRRPVHPAHWFFVLTALIGTAFIVNFREIHEWNKGDVLTFFCAIAAAFQIVALERATSTKNSSSIILSASMNLWAGLLAAGMSLSFGVHWQLPITTFAVLGLAVLTLGSTLVAFYLQVEGQKLVPASQASMLFLLESPFAAFFSALLLGERLNHSQAIGAFITVLSAVAATRLQSLRRSKSSS